MYMVQYNIVVPVASLLYSKQPPFPSSHPLGVSIPYNVLHTAEKERKRDYIYVLWFYVPPTAKVIWRQDLSLKSHPKDWRSQVSNSRPLVYKTRSLTTTPQRLKGRKNAISLTQVNIKVEII